jgi:hypothetical protein
MYNKVSQKGFTNLIRKIIKEEVDQASIQALNNLIDAWSKVPKIAQQSIINKKGYNPVVISQEIDSILGKAAYIGGSPKK